KMPPQLGSRESLDGVCADSQYPSNNRMQHAPRTDIGVSKKPASRSFCSLSSPDSQRLSCTTPCFTRAFFAAWYRAMDSASEVASGFSQYTCLPAAIARLRSLGLSWVEAASKKTSSFSRASA